VFLYGTAQMRRNRMPFISYQYRVGNPQFNFNPTVYRKSGTIHLCPDVRYNVYEDHSMFSYTHLLEEETIQYA